MADSSPGNPLSSPSASALAAEQRARELLAQAKWRKARDLIKPLFKADRERYLPLLIQANLGLIRQMMAKGQAAEARQVLDYLARIAPAERLVAVELEFAGRTDDHDEALPKLMAVLADPDTWLSEAETARWADGAVLAFRTPPAADDAQERLAVEASAVQAGLKAVSEAKWAEVPEILRGIPHRSAFRHWAAFIKGTAAFYTGEDAKAARCFKGLPPDSVPARTARAFRLLMDSAVPEAGSVPGAWEVQAVGQLTGAATASGLLSRADQAWKKGHHQASYRVFRDAIQPFPSPRSDWLGALAEFYFHAPHAMSESDSDKYVRYFEDLMGRGAFKNGAEEMFARRMCALVDGAIMPASELRYDWERFLHQYEAQHGHNPRLASLAYGWLGEQLAVTTRSFGYFGPGEEHLRDGPGAIDALQRAITLDPLDPLIPSLCLTARRRLACEYFRQRKPDKARETLAPTEPLLNENTLDFQHSRWAARGDERPPSLLLETVNAPSDPNWQYNAPWRTPEPPSAVPDSSVPSDETANLRPDDSEEALDSADEFAMETESSALEDWKDTLREDFEAWLADLDEIPAAADPMDGEVEDTPDLYSFYEQLAAANTESRKANRRTAEAISQWGDTLARFEGGLEPLRETVAQLTAVRPREEALSLAHIPSSSSSCSPEPTAWPRLFSRLPSRRSPGGAATTMPGARRGKPNARPWTSSWATSRRSSNARG